MTATASSARSELAWSAAVCLLGAAVAALGLGAVALPSGSKLGAYLPLVGGAVATAVPLAVGLRVIRRPSLVALLLGGWLALGPLCLFGALLKANTHHRPLAAATYAVVALIMGVGSLAVSARLVALSKGPARRIVLASVAALALVSALLVVLVLRRGFAQPGLGQTLLDGFVLVAVAAGAARVGPRRRIPAIPVVLMWLAVVAAGAQALSDPSLALLATDRAPLLVGPLWVFV